MLFYTPAESYYDLLCRAFVPPTTAPVAECYQLLVRLFRQLLDEQLADCPISFAGTAAQLKYLIRRCHIPAKPAHLLQAMREHLHAIDPEAEHDPIPLANDLYALCLLIYYLYKGAPPPSQLTACFPAVHDIVPLKRAVRGEIRVEVLDFDTQYIYAEDTENNTPLRVILPSCDEDSPLRPLADYLHAGATLNLIRPREVEKEGEIALEPELIVYEPDYLINISSIAACFRPEGISPFTYLLGKLRPTQLSNPIELGNLAGELLDLHVHHKVFHLKDAIMQFARRRALIASSPRIDYDRLAGEAERQSEYIRQALDETLHKVSTTYRREELLLEPSFYGQVLGLEGRMDLLQRNLLLLIEQKAGKGAFYRLGDAVPQKQEAHYVQILLYQALLDYALQQRGATETYLLYSKYSQPLLSVGPAPKLLSTAIALRNELVAYEEHYRRYGFGVLRSLTPEVFNTQQRRGKLWECYTEPELRSFLAPCQEASPVAWSYFVRLSRSVVEEQALAKVGSGASQHYGAAGRWLLSLGERQANGTLLTHLAVHLDPEEQGHYSRLTFTALAPSVAFHSTSFRLGDLVAVYPCRAGEHPDIRRQVFLKGKIAALGASEVVVQLNFEQSSPLIFEQEEGGYWVIEGDSNDSSFSTRYQGLYSFLRCGEARQELILQQRPPRVDETQHPLGEYGELQELVRRVVQARELFLVLGPPGTGKTSHVMMSILREELLRPDTRILLTAFTHRAVNEMASKVHAAGIDFLYIASELVVPTELHPYLLSRRVATARSVEEMRAVLKAVRVVCINVSALAAQLVLLESLHFSLAIVDEASQLLEVQLLPLLCANEAEGRMPIERFVLIGDHKQLPAIAQQDAQTAWVEEPELRAAGLTDCRNSFFERFYRAYRNDASVTYFLTCQARMHPEIAEFVNKHFYEGRLTARGLPHQLQALPDGGLDRETPRVVQPHPASLEEAIAHHRFFFVDYTPTVTGLEAPHQNAQEAAIIAEVVRGYVDYYVAHGKPLRPREDIGVILPYRRQIAQVREALRRAALPEVEDMTIDTVERYQGSERKIIIYGFTVLSVHQLNFLTNSVMEENGALIDRKLNVVITRAREHLVMVGHAALLRQVPLFAELLDYLAARR